MAYRFTQCEILDAKTMYPSENYYELEAHASPDWDDDSMAEKAVQFHLMNDKEELLFSGLIEFKDLANRDKFTAPINDSLVGELLPDASRIEFLLYGKWCEALHKNNKIARARFIAEDRNRVYQIGAFEYWS